MKFAKIMIIIVIFVFAMSVSCAADTNNASISEDNSQMLLSLKNEITDDTSENSILAQTNNVETLSAHKNSEILRVNEEGNYSDLRNDIINNGGNLKKSYYHYQQGDGNTIVINIGGFTVNGNGAVIDMKGSTNMRAFLVTGSGVTFKNLTIKNANFKGHGGAIYFSNDGTVSNCNFTGNTATGSGGAIWMGSGSVSNCNFAGNTAKYGGAIYFAYSDIPSTVTNCNFAGNTATNGYGGAVYIGGTGDVRNCNFTGNNATGNGGAVYFESTGTVSNCNFTANTVRLDGGAIWMDSGSVSDCNFTGNNATGDGGAIWMDSGSVSNCNFTDNKATALGGAIAMVSGTVSNCNFTGNNATGGGGAIIMGSGTVSNCNFTDNKATGLGGAIGMSFGTVSNCNFTGNNATTTGGAVYFRGTGDVRNCNFSTNNATRGGAIWMNSGTVSNCNFSANNATYGGAVYFWNTGNVRNCNFTGNTATRGGAISIDSGNVINCNFTGNTATLGGAVFFESTGNVRNCNFTGNNATNEGGAILMFRGSVENCTFTGNTAEIVGGALYFNNECNVTNCIFTLNKANFGGAISGSGKGNVTNCIFTNNTARNDGGAISFGEGNVTNCIFTYNTAGDGGAIFFDSGSGGSVTNCTFTNNTANNGGVIYWYMSANGTVSNCTFTNNTATIYGGGAIYWHMSANGTVSNCTFTNNTATIYGGAIDWYMSANGTVSNCTFTNNTADVGGAIWAGDNSTISDCTFTNNTANNGGVIYWMGDNGAVSDCTFTNNTADVGGAITWVGDNSTISDCTFTNNTATIYGGAITWVGGNGDVNNCALVNNNAPTGSEIYINRGNPNLNYNWWGSNNPNWDNLINGTYELSVYAILNMTANPNEIYSSEKSDITTKFIWNGTNTDATNLIPKRNVKLSSNGTLTETEGTVGLTSEFSATSDGVYYVNATVDNEIIGVNVKVKGSGPKKDLNISGSAEPIIAGENATIIVTGFENATGDVTARIDGGLLSTTIVNGTATFNVPGLTSSTTAYISYGGNEEYNAASTTVNITVIPKSDVVIVAENVTKYYHGSERFIVTVTNASGVPIAGKTVTITINGVTYTRVSDNNGTASIPLNLNSGEYEVTVVVDNITVKSLVTILTTVNGTDVVKVFRNATQYYATFRDSTGKYLAQGTSVKFNINGVIYTRTVEGNEGLAKLNINLPQGSYIITATNLVTGESCANNITVISRILENKDLVKYYRNASQFVVKVIDSTGKVAPGLTVTYNVNGVFYYRTTDADGYARLNINLPPGDYIITSEIDGCRVANNIKVLPTLTANDMVKKYGSLDPFVATLVDGQGKPYANQMISFNINGVFYNKLTDSNGQTKLDINLPIGEYIITSSYGEAKVANKITITS